MLHPSRSDSFPYRKFLVAALLLASTIATAQADRLILHLKNGDRVSGTLVTDGTNAVTLTSAALGTIQVPLGEISQRELIPEPPPVAVAPAPPVATNAPPATPTNAVASADVVEKKDPPGPIKPANPEATPIASTPSFWKHDIRFGLNLRYSSLDSQDFSAAAKSIYGKTPFRHIFDVNFRYGKVDGNLSANSLSGSEKTEYQLSHKTYAFSLVGGGYDEVRKIDAQWELGPGFGIELLKLTNFVWKSEIGINFQEQFRTDDTHTTVYSVRVAEIFAWRIWEKLTADAKIEFFPSISDFGEYRLRLESTLRYPVSKLLSLNLDVIDLYDTQAAQGLTRNDLQIRSSIGVTF